MPHVKEKDLNFMHHALSLARRNLGFCAPNPSVGCVIVKNGRIIGRGVTGKTGRPHAENIALTQAGGAAKDADVYVTLEPCAHTGQTPPCAQALIKARVGRVFIGCKDPDPRVNGGGASLLREMGVEVIGGVLEKRAAKLHSGFIKRITLNRPQITLKVATSLDGKIALGNGQSQWITGARARKHVHYLRSTHDGILTGSGTVLQDDPQMTARLDGVEHKMIRFVLDTHLRVAKTLQSCPDSLNLPRRPSLNLTRDTAVHPVIILYNSKKRAEDNPEEGGEDDLGEGIRHIGIPTDITGRLDVHAAVEAIATLGVNRLMIEGGAQVLTSFFKAGLWDALYWYRAPKIIGGDGVSMCGALNFDHICDVRTVHLDATRRLGQDTLNVYFLT
jgi:diaminohydroxyphosphoribosylaminopyrimidine deaminase/5-amino-6-(5-phosphoribosylamino)uracil reductase